MEMNPLNPRDPAWQFVGVIFGIVALIIAALALPDAIRLLGISIVIAAIIIFLCFFLVLRIRNKPRNSVASQESRPAYNLVAPGTPNLNPQPSTYLQSNITIIERIKLISPLFIILISAITIGTITALFPKQAWIEASSWQEQTIGLSIIVLLYMTGYFVDFSVKFFIKYKNSKKFLIATNIILYIYAAIGTLGLYITSHIFPNVINFDMTKKEVVSHMNSNTSLIYGTYVSFALLCSSSVILIVLPIFLNKMGRTIEDKK